MASPQTSDVLEALKSLASPEEAPKVARFYRGRDPDTEVLGVSIGKVFPIAKQFVDLPLEDVESLMESSFYEVRMAAVAILDFKARNKRISDAEREALFDLYIRRHDRIDNWDLVDRAAPHVVGEYLVGRERSILTELARSDDPCRRRTALVATHAFIKRRETSDTFHIAEILAADPDEYVQKAIASWTREAGKTDPESLIGFLRANRGRLARATVTAATKGLDDEVRAEFMAK